LSGAKAREVLRDGFVFLIIMGRKIELAEKI
jgi:hypothetical protein